MGSGGEGHMMAGGWRAEWQQGGVWRQAVWGLVMGLCVGAVAGAPAALQSTSSSSSGDNGAGGEVGCDRPKIDVILGFGLSLLAAFVANWNASQGLAKGKFEKLFSSSVFTLLGPIVTIVFSYDGAFKYVPMIRYLHKLRNEEMTIARIWAMLNPFSKSPSRFLASCHIIMCFQEGEESVLLEDSRIWEEKNFVEDETEAMVVGEKLKYKRIDVEDGTEAVVLEPKKREKIQYVRKQLSVSGRTVLLWGEYFSPNYKNLRILPKYGQLKFLRANNGFAVIAIGIQATGYIYAVIFRSVNDLRVAPVEVIGLVINIVLLLGVILYGTSNPCARPLVIYMDKEREGKFVNALQSYTEKDIEVYQGSLPRLVSILIFMLTYIAILLYFIVTLGRATNIMIVLPIIIFAASLPISVYLDIESKYNDLIIWYIIILSNIVAYIWAVIVTFQYWKSQHFNTRSPLINLSQLIPFIG